MINKKRLTLFVLLIGLSLTSLSLAIFLPNKGITAVDEDVTPPVIETLVFSTNEIDTDDADVDVTITMRLTDDITGLEDTNDYSIRMVPLGGDNGGNQMVDFNFTRISGDNMDATYESTATFPQYSATGDWVIYAVGVWDIIGNSLDWYTEDFELEFGAENVRVNNIATIGDNLKPWINSFSIPEEYREISTQDDDAFIKVEISIEDDQIGFIDTEDALIKPIIWVTPTEYTGQSFQLDMVEVDDLDGNPLTQSFEGSTTLPKGSTNGYWNIESIIVADAFGNWIELMASAGDIESEFGLVNSHILNTATSYDDTPPTLTSFSASPTEIDTSTGDATINISLTLEDDFSGIGTDEESMPWIRLYPLIGTQWRDATMVLDTKYSDMEASFTGTVTLPQFSKLGVWEVTLSTSDIIGNGLSCFGAELLECNPSSQGIYIVNTAMTDEVTIERDWSINTSAITVEFPEGTVVTKQEGGDFGFYRMVSLAYDISEANTTEEILNTINNYEGGNGVFDTLYECAVEEGCVETEVTDTDFEGEPIGVLRTGIPGLNIEFSQDVSVTIHNLEDYENYVLNVQTFQEGGESWANEEYCTVSNGDCTFTVNHASFFGASVFSSPDDNIEEISDTDLNNDGTPDEVQYWIDSILHPDTGKYVVLEAVGPEGMPIELTEFDINPLSHYNISDQGFDNTIGLVNFQLEYFFFPELGDTEGTTFTIKSYFYGDYDASTAVIRKYNPNTGELFTIPNTTIENDVFGDEKVLIVSFEITDGGELDMDGEVNGVIIDPFGPAFNTAGVPKTGLGQLGYGSLGYIKSLLGLSSF
jgi:hypothetical protein